MSTQDTSNRAIVAVFGASFNPTHLAHVLALAVVHARYEVDRIVVVPTFQHPFAKQLAPFEDRVKMCELAMGFLPRVEISRIEEELGGESKTLRTLEKLQERHPGKQLRLMMGADIIVESAKWHRFDRIKELAPPIVLGRVGVSYEGAPAPVLPNISSTEVRRAFASKESSPVLEELVPRKVVEYARARSLYMPSS